MLLAEVWFTLKIDDPTVAHLFKGRAPSDNPPVEFDGSIVSWVAVAVTAVALGLAIVEPLPEGLGRRAPRASLVGTRASTVRS